VRRWRAGTPPGFVFAAKGSRYLTHMKRLLDPEPGLVRYFEPVSLLRHKLAVVVYFNNDVGGHAVHDARDLIAMLPEVVRMDDAAGAAARQ